MSVPEGGERKDFERKRSVDVLCTLDDVFVQLSRNSASPIRFLFPYPINFFIFILSVSGKVKPSSIRLRVPKKGQNEGILREGGA